MYPAPSLSILGSREFVREVTREREPRRTRGRNDSGPKLPLPKLGEILGQAAGVALEELCCPHKGSRRQSEVREQVVHVATRWMFYAGMEVAGFLGVTSGAITLANRPLHWPDCSGTSRASQVPSAYSPDMPRP